MKTSLLVLGTLLIGNMALTAPGDVKEMNAGVLRSSKVCTIAPGPTSGEDYRILCGGRVAVSVEGTSRSLSESKRTNEKLQILSLLVGILYDADFAVLQTPNVPVQPYSPETLYLKK